MRAKPLARWLVARSKKVKLDMDTRLRWLISDSKKKNKKRKKSDLTRLFWNVTASWTKVPEEEIEVGVRAGDRLHRNRTCGRGNPSKTRYVMYAQEADGYLGNMLRPATCDSTVMLWTPLYTIAVASWSRPYLWLSLFQLLECFFFVTIYLTIGCSI